nr:MAG TPA: hypothetical protein [Caudoviricetes sp.]
MTVKEFLKRGRLLNREILELTEARTRAFNAACGGGTEYSCNILRGGEHPPLRRISRRDKL